MVWRRSSAMAPFLGELAAVFRQLPPALLDPRPAPAPPASAQAPIEIPRGIG
jgi:LysR family hydrogen peroxide-inducible transcriptional activator